MGNKVKCVNGDCARHPHVALIDAIHNGLEEIEGQAKKKVKYGIMLQGQICSLQQQIANMMS